MTAALRELPRRERHRNPRFDLAPEKLKTGRHYANDRVLLAAEKQLPADDACIAAVTLLPEFMAQYDHLVGLRLVVVRQNSSAQSGCDAEQRKKGSGGAVHDDSLGLAVSR